MQIKLLLFIYQLKKYLKRTLKRDSLLYELLIFIPQKIAEDYEVKDKIKADIETIMKKKKYPLFETIELETINRCNGACSFCPVNRKDDSREFKKMDEELFKKIVLELKELNFDGRLQLFSNNEPFLDKRIYDFAKFARENCDKAHISIFTNGTLLNLEKFKKIIDYVDTFCIDDYYTGERQFKNNIKEILKYCLDKPELKNKVIVQLIDQTAVRNNRGGKSKNRHITYKLKTICKLPFIQVIVRPDGKLSLCCNDALGAYTLGDLTKDKLINIWNSKQYQIIREKLYKKGRDSIKLCEYCDNFGGSGLNGSKNEVFPKSRFNAFWNGKDIKNMIKEYE